MSENLRTLEELLERRKAALGRHEALAPDSIYRQNEKEHQRFLSAQRAGIRVIEHEIRKERALCGPDSSGPSAGSSKMSAGGA